MRYVPHTAEDRESMCAAIGVGSVEELFRDIPEALRAPRDMPEFPRGLSEPELMRHAAELAARNQPLGSRPSFLGGGCYRHYIPPIVDALASRGEFLTAYTPYQAEASQGTLQAIYEFQSMVAELAGLEVSNASLYDGATALVEAVAMLAGSPRPPAGRGTILLSKGIHPEYRDTVRTYFANLPFAIEEVDLDASGQTSPEGLRALAQRAAVFAFQSPTFPGTIEDARALCEAAHAAGARVVQVFSPVPSALLISPGEAGADAAVADGQPLGNVPNYGGPHVGLFATRKEHLRKLPGRIVGRTVDRDGRVAYVLTLQTREQHIRREKATSNICTNTGLIALRTTIHLATLGKQGLAEAARICLERAHYAAGCIARIPGFELRYPGTPHFHEVAVRCPRPASEVNRALAQRGILGGLDLGRFEPAEARTLLLCFTELTTPEDIERLLAALAEVADEAAEPAGGAL